jgi:hypothetical protein
MSNLNQTGTQLQEQPVSMHGLAYNSKINHVAGFSDIAIRRVNPCLLAIPLGFTTNPATPSQAWNGIVRSAYQAHAGPLAQTMAK